MIVNRIFTPDVSLDYILSRCLYVCLRSLVSRDSPAANGSGAFPRGNGENDGGKDVEMDVTIDVTIDVMVNG